jgi:cytochrome bd ubiquinol oxidase subunit II
MCQQSARVLPFFISGLVPSLVFGVAFGNVLLGAPFHFEKGLQLVYEGNLLGLLNPFSLLCGLISIAMLVMQGASFLAGKSEGEITARARRFGAMAAAALLVLFTIAGIWVALAPSRARGSNL